MSSPKISKINFKSASAYKIVGERCDDDLPCCVCDAMGSVAIVEIEGCTYDICHGCAIRAGFSR